MIFHIVEGTTTSLPFFIMIEQIKNAARKSKGLACLPYEMVFALIFREVGIELDGENCKPLKHTDYYSIYTLHCMKFHKERDERIREGEEEQPEEVPGSSSSSPLDNRAILSCTQCWTIITCSSCCSIIPSSSSNSYIYSW